MANGLPSDYVYDGAGTGTEADPYVPVTCYQFMYAIYQSNAYVKMTTIIDFSKDDNYKTGITSNMEFRCDKLYTDISDSTDLYGINGFNTTSDSLFYHDRQSPGTTVIDHVCFHNCIWTKSADYSHWVIAGSVGNTEITNCSYSVLVKQNGHYCFLERSDSNNPVSFENCSQYFIFSGPCKYMDYNVNGQTMLQIPRNGCTIEFSNLRYYPEWNSNTYGQRFIGSYNTNNHIKNCTIYGDIHVYTDEYHSYLTIKYGESLYIALRIIHENSDNGYPPQIRTENSRALSVIDKDIIDSTVSLPSNNYWTLLTTSQMKSQQELIAAGFIP